MIIRRIYTKYDNIPEYITLGNDYYYLTGIKHGLCNVKLCSYESWVDAEIDFGIVKC